MKAIEVEGLTKKFDRVTAVDNISFEVEGGQCFGLVGPNEAGKTTTLMLLATVLNPDSGLARVCGHSILDEKDEVRTNIGMVFEEMSLDIQLTGKDNLNFHACMYHMPRKVREERVAEVLRVVDLEGKADIPVKNYSGGMQRRLEIARSMLTHPRVLLLDEPTVGLDVQTRRFMWDYVKGLNRERGMTVLLATHYIEEADYLCDRIGIMNNGRIAATGTPQELKDSVGKSVVSLSVSGDSSDGFPQMLEELPWVEGVQENNGFLEVGLRRENVNLAEIAELAQLRGLTISSISIRKPSLENAFFRCVGIPLEGEQ
ncbi:MAG: ATP-binding cassette domain-containing protein [Dehalococcoidia bacterium]